MKYLPISITFLLIIVMSNMGLQAQTTFSYSFDTSTVYMSPVPTVVGGVHPATNYSTVTKPLVCEAFANNAQSGVISGSIYTGAAGFPNSFFGGDAPYTVGYGRAAVPITTSQSFNLGDLPIYFESNFFNRNTVGEYNEGYLFLVPSSYTYFGSITYYVNSNIAAAEGIYIGGLPYKTAVRNRRSTTQTDVDINSVNTHNIANFGNWYNLRAIIDTLNGDLVIRDVKLDTQCVFASYGNAGPITWLNNFRLGVAVDDLAHDFIIKTNYSTLQADFYAPDTICIADSLNLINLSASDYCNDTNTYQWYFTGANSSSSNDENPHGLVYSSPGIYPVKLIVSSEFEIDSITKYIYVGFTHDSIIAYGCDTVFSPSGNYYWTNSGWYNDTIFNGVGCDTILFVNVNINALDTSVITYGNTLISQANNAQYQWLRCEGSYYVLPGATGPIYSPPNQGYYAVALEVGNCKDTSACHYFIPNALEDYDQSTVRIFPQPVKDILMIDSDFQFEQYKLYSIEGKLIATEKLFEPRISFTSILSGFYILELVGDNKSIKRMIIKE